mmetsp:Transcript_38903/g.107154  ORF Transcript_38903/g.107154 Transcript_38903/m.107154 type:complete len:281 (-) Transcript_38903:468-1310(-)
MTGKNPVLQQASKGAAHFLSLCTLFLARLTQGCSHETLPCARFDSEPAPVLPEVRLRNSSYDRGGVARSVQKAPLLRHRDKFREGVPGTLPRERFGVALTLAQARLLLQKKLPPQILWHGAETGLHQQPLLPHLVAVKAADLFLHEEAPEGFQFCGDAFKDAKLLPPFNVALFLVCGARGRCLRGRRISRGRPRAGNRGGGGGTRTRLQWRSLLSVLQSRHLAMVKAIAARQTGRKHAVRHRTFCGSFGCGWNNDVPRSRRQRPPRLPRPRVVVVGHSVW